MKQLKFLMVAFTLLMGISLTSCLNSESDPYSYGGGMVKVSSGFMGNYSFKSADGKTTITPTSASIAALEANGFKLSTMDGQVAQIYYRWDSSVLNIAAGETNIKGVELYSIESLDNKVEIVASKGAPNDSLSLKNNAPIITMSNTGSGMEFKPTFFDETTILLPINYFITQKRHYLTLVYYQNEDNGSLKLYLAHNSNGDTEATNSTSYSLTAGSNGYYGLGLFYKAYDLKYVFSRLQGPRPTSVEIVTKVNQYSNKLTDNQTEEKVFTVNYKEETEK